ncbi:MAG: hypothetical protein EZS28_029417, partial [Streblomastix strix]
LDFESVVYLGIIFCQFFGESNPTTVSLLLAIRLMVYRHALVTDGD